MAAYYAAVAHFAAVADSAAADSASAVVFTTVDVSAACGCSLFLFYDFLSHFLITLQLQFLVFFCVQDLMFCCCSSVANSANTLFEISKRKCDEGVEGVPKW